MKIYDIAIMGAGASGSMCALSIKNKSVALIDTNYKVAKKILVTGNGRCNLTNIHTSSKHFNVNIDKYLAKFSVDATLDFFRSIGLEYYADDMGRVYPISNSAKSVMDIIDLNISNNVDKYLDSEVLDISHTKDYYTIATQNGDITCKNLVMAIGGGNNAILQKLGVKYREFTPSLVALKTNSTKSLNNIKVSNVKVTATLDNKSMTDYGEVLFKDSGLSGIVIFNLSTLYARANNYTGVISVDLLPNVEHSELIAKLHSRKKLNLVLSKFFTGFFQNQIAEEICRQAKIDTNKLSTKLSDSDIEILATTIKNLTFEVKGTYDNNQVSSGGVSLSDLGEHLEYSPHLFFIGEVCDVDGECGGYNLQWAWTSGHIVGEYLC